MRTSLLTLFVLISSLFGISLITSVVSAQDAGDAVCDTLGQATGNNCETVNESGLSINNVVEGALNLLTFAAGVATVVMVLIGGFKYITSKGDATAITNAKNTILYALIGVVIVVLSQTIVYFFVGSASPTAPVNCTGSSCPR